ncbi:phage tail protein I [Pseudoduganella namucuonensis]|uniref:Phage tail protein, P2 protein I family n=1 Tax=Pseudoduganella namucuonensis TaxID=1035707 RepID=A0A1I7M4Z4_9BURK|nr:phage tail protein I [Pseudoduganella namucuonensis]SFV16947.1 phage tail protein, P2 protein I family [Pseudoduganella namucuonensis]
MRLIPDNGTVLMRGQPHWLRCAFQQTALVDDIVTLAPAGAEGGEEPGGEEPFTGGFAGMAFDSHCRLFHPVPGEGRVEYVLWGRESRLAVHDTQPRPFELSVADEVEGEELPQQPVALACDERDYLYIADPAAKAVWLADTWQQEIARRVDFPSRPLDLARQGDGVYVLLDAPGWMRLAPCDEPEALPWPEEVEDAHRLVVTADGRAFVLCDAGTADAEVVCLQEPALRLETPFCTDLLVAEEHAEFGALFVFARRPGEDFVRRRLKGRGWAPLTGLYAPQYDGRGIARAPDGRIAYWSARGPRHAAPARTQYERSGWLFGFALDSGLDQNRWGALSVEACIPDGTRIRFHALTRDDLDFGDPLPRTPPAGQDVAEIAQPTVTPLPSMLAWQYEETGWELYRDDAVRLAGPKAAPGYARYEAPVHAPPGRYLWLVFELTGTKSKTPRLRSARAAYPGHTLLRQLPRTLWRDPEAEDFLHRYLMSPAAMLAEWGDVSQTRQRLLNPRGAPAEVLDWLASFLGLAMDHCWSERARRQMIEEAARLFRGRGTLWSLRRMLEILTGAQVLILEKFRTRGGGVIGNPEATSSQAVLGVGFRVGGAIGEVSEVGLDVPGADDGGIQFDQYAHRFTVTIVASMSEEQLRCARQLVEVHKPAHTMFDLCTADAGTRVGVGLHIGLASVVGDSSGFEQAVVGDSVLGKGYLLGRPGLDRGPDGGQGGCP